MIQLDFRPVRTYNLTPMDKKKARTGIHLLKHYPPQEKPEKIDNQQYPAVTKPVAQGCWLDSRRWVAAFLAVSLAGLILFLRPLNAQPFQWADDALYFRTAKAFCGYLQGQSKEWLGSFDAVLLSKAPLFAVFLAGIHLLNIPLRLTEWLLFFPLPFLMNKAVKPAGLSSRFSLFLGGICFYWIPIGDVETRLLRNFMSSALLLHALVALGGFVIYFYRGEKRYWAWLIYCALFAGLASIAREEAAWIMLPICGGGLGLLLLKRSKIIRIGIIAGVFSLVYYFPVAIVSALNYLHYDIYAPSLRQDASFRRLFSTLCSLDPSHRVRYVPVRTETRELAYVASPAFARLKPYLEGRALEGMARSKHRLAAHRFSENQREFFVANFEFALARAIVLAGNNTGSSFKHYCDEAAYELQGAVARGDLQAAGWSIGLLPPIPAGDLPRLAQSAFRSFFLLVSLKGQVMPAVPTPAPSKETDEWYAFTCSWPALAEKDPYPVRSFIFKTIIWTMRILNPAGLLAMTGAIFLAFKKRRTAGQDLLLLMVTSFIACAAFCLAMALVDTVGFPHLQWPTSYNRLGFYPLHFFLFVSFISFLYYLDPPKSHTND